MRFVPKVGALVLALYLAWLGWLEFGPRRTNVGTMRAKIAKIAVDKICDDLHNNRGEIHSVVLLPFANDTSNCLTDKLRTVLEQRGTLNLKNQTLGEKLRNKLNLEQLVCDNDEEALNRAKGRKADGVLYGKINIFESFSGGANMNLEYKLLSIATGKVVYEGKYLYDSCLPKNNLNLSSTEPKGGGSTIPSYLQVFGWLLIVLLLPIFTISFIKEMVLKKSNGINIFVLALYSFIDIILVFLMVGANFSLVSIIIFVVAMLIAIAYNITIMSFALKLNDG